ncbi:Pup--protein ligase [Corynebacterium aquilae]|uniref:Pup--protein ligase n=1 Tax=Corynebacterium aquilae DSM 44791 TaxID=1431546 RepID=A0A1L7CFX8_9CORY|nr:Pup--protein ligase [Corynebacterium aquilae]APT84749.1 Pup--protein ligase [Corynebacterium aquilae DSM 44791]
MAPSSVFTRRIMGIETEYGITCTQDGSRRLSPDDSARYLFRPVVEQYQASNIFTPNSSRLYLDVGSHPEVATPECDSVRQLLTYDLAGDAILNELAIDAEQRLAREGIGGEISLFKNNVDSLGNSYGCHENYLVARDVVLKALSMQLVPFLITRQLICGAGKIYRPHPASPSKDYGLGFCISQRADHVWDAVSSATTRSRPIINTRDEPHADSHRFRRLHVIVGDSTIAQPTTRLKIGSTLLVLEMLEAKTPGLDFDFADPSRAIRDIARDITGTTPIALADGTHTNALAVQRTFLDAATAYYANRTPDPDLAAALDLWQRTLDAIDSGQLHEVGTEIDWIIKYQLIQRYQHSQNLPLDHPKLLRLDLAYHDIRPGRGLGSILAQKNLMDTFISDQDIASAVTQAPTTTRAHARGKFLHAIKGSDIPASVDWTRCAISRPEPASVDMLDPFQTDYPELDELINTITGAP